jgi:hypothetical protein
MPSPFFSKVSPGVKCVRGENDSAADFNAWTDSWGYLILFAFSRTDEQKSPERLRELDRFAPFPGRETPNFVKISPSDPQQRLFRIDLGRGRPFQECRKFADRSRTREIQRREFLSEILIAANDDPSPG